MVSKLCGLLIVAGTILAGVGKSQTPGAFTLEMLNGRGWKILTPSEKLYMLAGMQDGLIIFHVFSNLSEGKASEAAHEKTAALFYCHFNRGEVSTKIDEIYGHTENVNVPVVYAFYLAIAIFNGKTNADEDLSYLPRLRKEFSTSDPQQ